jgi:hypothetical protein
VDLRSRLLIRPCDYESGTYDSAVGNVSQCTDEMIQPVAVAIIIETNASKIDQPVPLSRPST